MNRNITPTSSKVRAAFKSPIQQSPSNVSNDVLTKDQLEKQIKELTEKSAILDSEIAELEKKGCKEEELDVHIDKLHTYNEIKDVAQMVMGRIAVLDGVTTKIVHETYGIGPSD